MTELTQEEIEANRAKLFAKRGKPQTGGKGSVRRKKKTAVARTSTADDKKLGNYLKKIGVKNIPDVEEANMFKDNGEVIHFKAPKLHLSFPAKTYVLSGNAETKQLKDLVPGIIDQLDPAHLQQIVNTYAQAGGNVGGVDSVEEDDDDDDVPDLVENFEEVAST